MYSKHFYFILFWELRRVFSYKFAANQEHSGKRNKFVIILLVES